MIIMPPKTWRSIIQLFIMHYGPMADGLPIVHMEMYGYQTKAEISDLTALMGIGYIRMQDGHGNQIINGVGLLSIMEDGIMMIMKDGCGCLEVNGRRHG